MGGGRMSSSDWAKYTAKSGLDSVTDATSYYTSSSSDIRSDFLPINIKVRESCDSEDNPNSTPIAIFLDVTGSMGSVLTEAAKGLGKLFEEIYDRKPVSDPHIMYGGIGDVNYDEYPIQVTQYEADIRIAQQMKDIYFERGGGGNDNESYSAAWYFCAMHTAIDSLTKRGKKGFLFTIGDELPSQPLTRSQIKKFFGDDIQKDNYTSEELFELVSKKYEVYHLIIAQGSYCRSCGKDEVMRQWNNIIGQNAIMVTDYTKISEIIVSILEVRAGKDKEDIINSWDGTTAVVVSDAIKNLSTSSVGSDSTDVVIF